eukprot:jgi/Tetstr1/450198/TSEL_037237.t1
MERESAGNSDSTSEGNYSAPRNPHRRSPESYDNIESWDAANYGPDVKKFYMRRRAEGEAGMEAGGEAGSVRDGGLRAGGVLPPELSKQFSQCALTARAICTGPLANLELPTVEQRPSQPPSAIERINTPPELMHAQWLAHIMMAAGVEMQQYHTEPKLMRVGDDNLCAISLGQEDEEFTDTLRMAIALTSSVALLRTVRLRTIVVYLTESEFDPSELLIHPFSRTVREA